MRKRLAVHGALEHPGIVLTKGLQCAPQAIIRRVPGAGMFMYCVLILLASPTCLPAGELSAIPTNLPVMSKFNEFRSEFEINKGVLYYIDLSIEEYSEISVSYKFYNSAAVILEPGFQGLRMFLRETDQLIEVLNRGPIINQGTATEVFNAAPGTYRLYIRLSPNVNCSFCISSSSDWSALPSRVKFVLDIRIKDNETAKSYPWVKILSDWLIDTGLSKHFSVANIAPYQFPSSPDELIENTKDKPGILIKLNTNLGNRPLNSSEWFDAGDDDLLASIEHQFRKYISVELWWLMATKVSLLSGLSRDAIDIRFPLYCAPELVQETSPGQVRRVGFYCKMGGAKRTLENLTFKVNSLSTGHTDSQSEIPKHFAEVVDAILQDIVEESGGKVTYILQSETEVEAEIFARGAVIRGGQLWEKVQIWTRILPYGQRQQVIIHVDGMVASGMDDSPPLNSRFTTPMEPTYAGDVIEFANIIMDRIVNYDN